MPLQHQKLVLDDWQQEALDHKGDLLLCTGRRIGKTYIMAKKAIERMKNNPGTKIVVVSLTEDQAELIIEFARQVADQECKHLIPRKKTELTKRKIAFKNGSWIKSRPVGNTGNAVRGFDGDILIVDEAARMPKLMWMAAKPILLMTGGELWICSTPAGQEGYFWEQYNKAYNKKDPQARFKVIYKTSEDIVYNRPISSSWSEEQRAGAIRNLEEEKLDMSELEYGQEYLGLFMEDLKRLFSDKWIAQVCTAKKKQYRGLLGPRFMGVDVARMGKDKGSYEVMIRAKDSIVQVESIQTAKKLTTETHDKILEMNDLWNLKQIGIDAGSGALGVGVLDWLLRSKIKKKVIPLSNISISLDKYGQKKRGLLKEDMYDMVLSLGERKMLILLKEEEVITSLRSVQYEIVRKPGQKTRLRVFSSPHSESHVMEGIVRGVWLANQKHLNSNISYF